MAVVNIEDYRKTEGVEYMLDESKVVGVTHSRSSMVIMRDDTGKETGVIDRVTGNAVMTMNSADFNELLISWLLIDNPSLIDDAAEANNG